MPGGGSNGYGGEVPSADLSLLTPTLLIHYSGKIEITDLLMCKCGENTKGYRGAAQAVLSRMGEDATPAEADR